MAGATAWAASRDGVAYATRSDLNPREDSLITLPRVPPANPSVTPTTGFGPIGAMALDGCTLYLRQGESEPYTFGTFGGQLFVVDVCGGGGPNILSQLPLASGSPGRLVPDGDTLCVTDDLGLLELAVRDKTEVKPVRMLAGPPLDGVVRLGDHLFLGGGPSGLFVAHAR